jgi:hypothetical protein
MRLYAPDPAEHELLQKYAVSLSLIDIETGETDLVLGDPSTSGPNIDERPIRLTEKFSIGSLRRKSVRDSSSQVATAFLERMIVSQFERAWVSHMMMTAINMPVPLDVTEETYYSEVARIICRATFARAVILRTIVEKEASSDIRDMPCLAVHDRRGSLDSKTDLLSLVPGCSKAFSLYNGYADDFRRNLSSVKVLRRETEPTFFELTDRYVKEVDIQTVAVAPLSINGRLSGFVTMVYDIEIDLSDVLELAFVSVVSHATAAIENFLKITEISELRRELLKGYMQNLQLDLIQGFRHAARTALELCKGDCLKIRRFYDFRGRPEDDPYIALGDDLARIGLLINNIASLRLGFWKRERKWLEWPRYSRRHVSLWCLSLRRRMSRSRMKSLGRLRST